MGLHLRTGECLEGGYGERAGEIAGELAMHFERGRDYERAARYRRQAGEHALRQHANREAADHATQALHLLEALPDSPERVQQELALQIMLGAALTATQGYGAAEVARPYERARELCAQVGDTVRLLPVLLGLGRFHQSRGELQIARDLGARLLGIADATDDAAVGLAAHNALGIMAFYAGEFEAALAHVEEGARLYDPSQHSPNRSATFRAGQDPGVSCAVYAAWTLQLLGHPARAAARMREALASARSLGHPFSVAYACHFAAGFHLYRREREAVREMEEETIAYSTEHGFRLFPMMGAIHRGWLLSEQARGEEALAQMRDGLAALRAIGIELRRPALLALLAEVYEKIHRPGEGLSAVEEALAAGAHGAAVLGCGAPSAAGERRSPRPGTGRRPRPPAGRDARRHSSRGHPDCAAPAGEVAGAARGDELESAVGEHGESERGARIALRDLRLVHGRLRHGRFERREVAARPARAPSEDIEGGRGRIQGLKRATVVEAVEDPPRALNSRMRSRRRAEAASRCADSSAISSPSPPSSATGPRVMRAGVE